jgi:N-carbamoyl-L-amino-acid hydrolase
MDYKNFSDISFIEKGINDLEKLTEQNKPYTRLVFSKEFYAGRDWLNKQFELLELETSVDEAGNLVGLLKSNIKTNELVIIGSHIDTVPSGGRYDGIAGIISALNVIKYIRENKIDLPYNIAIYDYLGEELNDWGISCLGSRGIAGLLNEDIFLRTDIMGRVLGEEINKVGGQSKLLISPLPIVKDIIACLELHIEQGKVLENDEIEIGVVRSIPSISRHLVSISGQAGHSGTVLMNQRSDSLVVASKLIIFINAVALKLSQESNQHFVATVGKINVHPNSAAIIPGFVDLTIDLRAVSNSSRNEFLEAIKNKIISLNEMNEHEVSIADLAFAPYIEMDKKLISSFLKSCDYFGFSKKIMDSGAGHDTAQLARVVPSAMIFIPCENGLSHCPEEFAKLSDIVKGTAVLVKLILDLAKL